jgi:hypothetical protein
MTTHNTYNRQTSVTPSGFEITIPAGERLQTYALDRAAIGTGRCYNREKNIIPIGTSIYAHKTKVISKLYYKMFKIMKLLHRNLKSETILTLLNKKCN